MEVVFAFAAPPHGSSCVFTNGYFPEPNAALTAISSSSDGPP
jgi:hypothetical protein